MIHKRFTESANMILNEYIRDTYAHPLHIDGEERVRVYISLKRRNMLDQLIYKNGNIDFTNEWVAKLIEEYISGHEGTYGDNSYTNQVELVVGLRNEGEIYLLFEDHYSYDALALL